MKQKLMLLMLLAVGLAACTKEDDGDIQNLWKQTTETPWDNFEEYKSMFGEFEGVWVIDQQEIDTAKLTVTNTTFELRYPLGYVVNKYFGKENTEFLAQYKSHFSPTGFANNTIYCEFSVNEFNLKVDDIDNVFSVRDTTNIIPFTFSRGTYGTASYDITTHLWMLKVTIEKISQNWTFDEEGGGWYPPVQITPTAPIILVYIAKKKI